MISLQVHAYLNVALNVVLLALLMGSLWMAYFEAFGYKVSLFSLAHTVRFEDVQGEAYATFEEFQGFACSVSQQATILSLCQDLPNYEVAGRVYFVLCCLLIPSVISAVLNLLLSTVHPRIVQLRFVHYTNCPITTLGVIIYLTHCGALEPGKAPLQGVFTLFAVMAVSMTALAHYVCYRHFSQQFPENAIAAAEPTVEELRRELEGKDEALGKAQAKMGAMGAEGRTAQDLNREIAILKSENSHLTRRVQRMMVDSEAGLSGNEKHWARNLAEAEKNIQDLDRQIINLKYENSTLRDQSSRFVADLKDQKPSELFDTNPSEIIRKQRISKQAVDTTPDEAQEIVQFQESNPLVAELEKEKTELATLNQAMNEDMRKLEEAHRRVVEEKERIAEELEKEQQSVRVLKTQSVNLQEVIQDLRGKLGMRKDVAEAQSLLEDSRRKELDDMKGFYEDRFSSLISEQAALRAQITTSDSLLSQCEAQLSESKQKREELETLVRGLNEERKSYQIALEEAEKQSRDAVSLHLRTEFDLRKKTIDLELANDRMQTMEETHAKAIAELTSSRGDQLEAIRKLYSDASQRDFSDHLAAISVRMEKLQTELEAERNAKSDIEIRNSSLEEAAKLAKQREADHTAQLSSQSSQIEELLIKLAHLQTLQKQMTDESNALKRTLADVREQLQTLQDAQESIQSLHAKVLRDQETRHEKEVDRMKELYEVTQAKETDELKKFYELKIGKIHGDLVNERQERLQAIDHADKLLKDKDSLQGEIARMQTAAEKQKQSAADNERRRAEEAKDWDEARSEMEKIIAALRAEVAAARLATVSKDVHQAVLDKLSQATAALHDKESAIKELQRTIEGMENLSNIPIAIKDEVRQLRENAERTADELTVIRKEIAGKETEIQRITALKESSEASKVALEQQLKSILAAKDKTDRDIKVVNGKLARKRERLGNARSQLSEVSLDRDRQIQDLTESYKLEKEKLKQTYIDIFQQDLEDIKQRYDAKVNSLSNEVKTQQMESVQQAGKLAEVISEKNKVNRANRDLSDEITRLNKQIDDLVKRSSGLKSAFESLESDNSSLRSLLDSLKKAGDSHSSQVVESLESKLSDLNRSHKVQTDELQSAQKELDELRNEVKDKEGELQGVKEECMALHNELLEMKEKMHPKSRGSTSFSRDEKRSGMTPDSSQSVKEIMIIDGVSSINKEKNPILEKVSKLKKEAPMTYTNVWKFFENMMQEKCKLDRLEMSLGRQPRTMTEFMLDFVYLHYGLKTLALKQLQALVTSLQELYRGGHPYGVLFCRFIGIFHQRPLPHHLAVYLLIVGEEFNALAERGRPRKSDKFAEQYDLLQYGGQASIIDLMELIVKISKGNREAGERIISQLSPDAENKVELIVYKVCGTMARMGKDPKFIFDLLDLDQGGGVDYHELVDGIRYKLNIWISHDEAVELCSYIDESASGQLSLSDWTSKVNFSDFSGRTPSLGQVTKSNFLSALLNEYEYAVVQDYYTLRRMIKRSFLDPDSLEDFLMQVDPGLDEKDFEAYYEEILQIETDVRGGISPEAACIVVLKHRVGGFGVGIFGEG